MTDETLFAEALEKRSAAERETFLAAACDNPEQRARVGSLLAAHDLASGFLDRPVVAASDECDATRAAPTRKADPNADELAHEDNPTAFLAPPGRPDSLGRIGHYDVLEVLGQGGFGIVYRAFDDKLQRVVAVKVLAPNLAVTSPARKRFVREARSAAAVRHENVVQIHAVEEHPLPHLVMEYVPGCTLQQRLDGVGPLDLADCLRIGRQVAEGLAAAHATGLIHRDIKPSNILLNAGPHPAAKITDFGLARAADDASLTRSGAVAGTPMYMSPEQARGETLDHRSDLFSLGSVLYVMASGRPPFRANSTLAVLKRVAEDTPRPIREVIPEVPEWACRIVGKLHAKNPAERFQTATEVADLLADCERQLAERKELTDFSRIPGGKPARRVGGRMWRRVGVGITAALAVLLVVMCSNMFTTIMKTFYHELTVQLPDTATVVQFQETTDTVMQENRWTFTSEWPLEPRVTVADTREQKLRLPPGNYYMFVSRDGKRVEQRLLTIGWGGSRTLTVASSRPPDPSPVDGFTPLFNGKDLTGWKEFPAGRGSWKVENGVLVGNGKPSHLFTERGDFTNFHLRMELRVRKAAKAGAVGVFTRVPVEDPGMVITPHGEFSQTRYPVPKLYADKLVGVPDLPSYREKPVFLWGEDLKGENTKSNQLTADEWLTVDVIQDGQLLDLRVPDRVRGSKSVDYSAARVIPGHLALQLFDDFSVVEVRKIEIKELPTSRPNSTDTERVRGDWIVASAESGGKTTVPKSGEEPTIRVGDKDITITSPTVRVTGNYRVDPVRRELHLQDAHDPAFVPIGYRFDGDRMRLTLPAGVLGDLVSSDRDRSLRNLQSLGIAAHAYTDTYLSLPPPAVTAPKGNTPLLSWRVALLPFLEEDELFRQFKRDEPWDSEHNKKLIPKMPKVFALPGVKAPEGHTHYRAFTGPGTVFEAGKRLVFTDILDGTVNTLLFVEADESTTWTKPDDLPFDPKKPLPKLREVDGKASAVFCDGHTATLKGPMKDDVLKALVTRSGGEKVRAPEVPRARVAGADTVLECVRPATRK